MQTRLLQIRGDKYVICIVLVAALSLTQPKLNIVAVTCS